MSFRPQLGTLMGRITIKDIAKLLEINPSTVSRALKDHPDISQETRAKVKRIANDLGYVPNLQAISFRNRKSHLIGLILPDMNMFFFPPVISAIEETVRKEGYNLIVLHSNNQLEREQENVRICQRLGVEGLLVSLTSESSTLDHFSELIGQGVPLILFDRVKDEIDIPTVIIHDEAVAWEAVSHLVSKGCKRICGIFGDPKLSISQLRKEGFRKSIEEFGLPLDNDLIVHAYDYDHGFKEVEKILGMPNRPDAFFTMSDTLLVGAMMALQKHKVQIPDEVAIISISHGEMPRFFSPKVSFVQHSGTRVGATAVGLLFKLIAKESIPKVNYIGTRLIVQDST